MTSKAPALLESDEELEPLSRKHQRFVDEYFLANFNGTEAYMRVYNPKGGRSSARVMAAELLAKPNISAAIETRLAEVHMSADEALKLLAEHARGDLADFMDLTANGFNISLLVKDESGELQTKANTRVIKKIKQKTTTIIGKKESDDDKEIHETEIELYDAQSALEKILRVHGKFKDPGTAANPFVIKGYSIVSPNDWNKDDSDA